MNPDRKSIMALFLISLSLRVLLFLVVAPWKPQVLQNLILAYWDPQDYHQIAINLLEHGTFSASQAVPLDPNIHRVPLYPLYISAFYAVFGTHPYIPIMFQLLIGSITPVTIYLIMKRYTTRGVALFAGGLMAIDYISIYYCSLLYSETIFTLIFLMHIYFLLNFFRTHQTKDLIYSGVLLGISSLCRVIAVYFFICLIAVFALHYKKQIRRGMLSYSILTLAFVLVLLPWMLRNSIISGTPLLSSAQGQVVGWHFVDTNRYLSSGAQNPEQAGSTLKSDQAKASRKEALVATFLLDTGRYIRSTALYLFQFKGTYGRPQEYLLRIGARYEGQKGVLGTACKMIQQKWFGSLLDGILIAFLITLYGIALYGFMISLVRRRFDDIAVFVLALAYFALATGRLNMPRYRVPSIPYIMLLSGYGLAQLHLLVKRRGWRFFTRRAHIQDLNSTYSESANW